MTFLSFSFIIFFGILMGLYFIIPKKFQWSLLLVFSYAFYYFASEKLPIYMIITTAVTFLATNIIQKILDSADEKIKKNKDISREEKKEIKTNCNKKRKAVLIIAICINIGILSIFKYTDFLFSNISNVLSLFGLSINHTGFNLILPLGISFYTFQSTGYIIDVYRKQVKAEKNFLKVALFVSYFPQIIEGPIGRFDKLAPQLFAEHSFSFDRTKKAVFLILFGFLKKLVIADNLAPMITSVVGNYSNYQGFQIILTCMLYGIQLYTDFSGCMDIAMGFSNVFDIQLSYNFKRPYFSTSVAEFWRRWHISLCSWFRDYLFYPLFMSKNSMNIAKKLRSKGHKTAATNIPTFIAMAIVWFLTGLWHNASLTEILWGLANGAIMIFSKQFKDVYDKINRKLHIKDRSFVLKLFRILRTYMLMTILNFMCEFDKLSNFISCTAIALRNPLPTSFSLSYLFPAIVESSGLLHIAVIFTACIALLLHSLYDEKHEGSVISVICKKSWLLQAVILIAVLLTVMLFQATPSDLTGGFMYAQF